MLITWGTSIPDTSRVMSDSDQKRRENESDDDDDEQHSPYKYLSR